MAPDAPWHQYLIEFTDPAAAVSVAAQHLAPALDQAQQAGALTNWWHLRKTPAWRLRYQPTTLRTTVVAELLDTLVTRGQINGWTRGIYEPETLAFGGETAMDITHALFHHDSRHILDRAGRRDPAPALGQRETTVLLFSALLRAAGLDWFEQGDVWAKIAGLRPAVTPPAARNRGEGLSRAIRRLMTSDPHSVPDHVPEPWTVVFETAGHQLAALARQGQLERGLRAVLAHHFIFHANRAGLPGTEQATLAALAVNTVFHTTTASRRPVSTAPTPDTTKVRAMTTTLSDASAASADELRNQLADRLRNDGIIRTHAVEAAFRAVRRHLFVPGVPLKEAYANEAVYTKQDSTGASVSAASQPTIVAMMLEQLRIEPGQHILELGAGTGYNAALMAAITGNDGHVTTIDVDDDLVDDARKHLTAAGVSGVDVVLADGALGYPEAAPFDRIIATVGAFEIPTPWLEQLTPAGRLVVPVRLAGAASRSIVFERDGDGWTGRGSEMAVFMPLRGIGDDARRVIDLTGNGEVTLQTHQDNHHATDPDVLTGVLNSPRREVWTGVTFVPMESFEWLDLWLACRLANPIMRMNVEASAKNSGLVTPMFPTVAMATASADGSLAYLTIRAVDPAPDGTRRYEVGVVGHGPTGQDLAESVAAEITTWDNGFRAREVHFAVPDTPPTADPEHGRFVLARPDNPMTVTWQ